MWKTENIESGISRKKLNFNLFDKLKFRLFGYKNNLVRSISILKQKYLKDNNKVKKRWDGYQKNRNSMIYRFKRKIRVRRKNKKKNKLKQILKWILKIRKIFNNNQIGIIKLFRQLNHKI